MLASISLQKDARCPGIYHFVINSGLMPLLKSLSMGMVALILTPTLISPLFDVTLELTFLW